MRRLLGRAFARHGPARHFADAEDQEASAILAAPAARLGGNTSGCSIAGAESSARS